MRIALIDDSPADCTWFRHVLSETGFTGDLSVYTTGLEALEQIASGPRPDVIVCDWYMPLWEFPELCTKLRTTPGLDAVPIVTFASFEKHKRLAEQMGVAATLTKPIDHAQISEIVQIGKRASAVS